MKKKFTFLRRISLSKFIIPFITARKKKIANKLMVIVVNKCFKREQKGLNRRQPRIPTEAW